MDKQYACYCGLYCENCAVKVKVEPAAKTLYDEMSKLGFEGIMPYFPDGDKFWSFLKGMVNDGICVSCKAGSGNPACQVRLCAQEKSVEMCALCESYPCELFTEFFAGYPALKSDNEVLRDKGWLAWAEIQEERKIKREAFFYSKNLEE
jgi:hypothetical protein